LFRTSGKARPIHLCSVREFAWRERFFGAGEIPIALLSLVAKGPSHGYELMKKLEERASGVYRAGAGTVYPTLQLLEDEGTASTSLS
jgi:DNA-binding PadR family transcriptional regulator